MGEVELRAAVARRLRLGPDALAGVRAQRLSFDARVRQRLWRLAVRVWERGEPVPPPVATRPPELARPAPGAARVAVIGAGPAGLFAALDLLAAGLNVTVLERGQDVRARRRALQALNRGEPADGDSNYCFGEGGAGTYSDGKLYARSGDKAEVRAVLETLVAHGAPEDILVSWRPHVGSNRLPEVVQALRATLEGGGAVLRFGARVEELVTRSGRVEGVQVRDVATGTLTSEPCAAVVLAAGHSAFDALELAARAGARLEPKGFAMGLRIEHAQAWLDRHQYGGLRGPCELPASFYELVSQQEGRGVYSFCMCPGGFIVPTTTDPERVVVNGMSLSRRDSPYANSGLVVQIEPGDWCGAAGAAWGWGELLARAGAASELPPAPEADPLFGARLQRALERVAARLGGGRNRAPCQRADLAAEGARARVEPRPTSYRPGATGCDLNELLPPGLHERLRRALADFDRKLPGFASEQGQLLGVESRTSSPVRVARDPESLESAVQGLYPCGEGAGFAGGIVSAALDGRRVAAALARALA